MEQSASGTLRMSASEAGRVAALGPINCSALKALGRHRALGLGVLGCCFVDTDAGRER